MTINEIVKKLQAGEFENPATISDYLVRLSASLNTGGQLELEAEINYAREWQVVRETCKTDKEAEMKAKLTDAYREMRIAQITNKTIIEVIRALKKKLQNLEIEFGSGQNY